MSIPFCASSEVVEKGFGRFRGGERRGGREGERGGLDPEGAEAEESGAGGEGEGSGLEVRWDGESGQERVGGGGGR